MSTASRRGTRSSSGHWSHRAAKPGDREPPDLPLRQVPTPSSGPAALFPEWVHEDKFPLEKLVTNRYSLEQIEEARVALEEGQILGRAIIEI